MYTLLHRVILLLCINNHLQSDITNHISCD